MDGNWKKRIKNVQAVLQLHCFLDSYCRAGLSLLHVNVRNIPREYLLCVLVCTLTKT